MKRYNSVMDLVRTDIGPLYKDPDSQRFWYAESWSRWAKITTKIEKSKKMYCLRPAKYTQSMKQYAEQGPRRIILDQEPTFSFSECSHTHFDPMFSFFPKATVPILLFLCYFKFILFIEPKYCIHLSGSTIFIIFLFMSVGANCYTYTYYSFVQLIEGQRQLRKCKQWSDVSSVPTKVRGFKVAKTENI